jgi:hypothetical protein
MGRIQEFEHIGDDVNADPAPLLFYRGQLGTFELLA